MGAGRDWRGRGRAWGGGNEAWGSGAITVESWTVAMEKLIEELGFSPHPVTVAQACLTSLT